ncbi:hypothetical protein EFA46_011860 (plasmid) [Halarchaeum sp. CBA1220]|uniref:hypothetical protein n=1 Tax=Halarchaeum sp. CBA1220 TaxID=1853682 RepID=UPI000F3A97EB|nr:hypothetical protein [Halarchaeum sp. CBA1220]QLC34948.1 hypothetical protein EFA46_011860 [Halarchaeum sp. CBA1220]
MGRARDTATEGECATDDAATLAAVDAYLASLRRAETPLSCVVDTALAARPERRPTRAVLEGAARVPSHPNARDVVAGASAVDLLDARTVVRWVGLPERAPESTDAVLVGDYLHSLAFEALVGADEDGVSTGLLAAVTAGVSDLYGAEAGVAATPGERDVPVAARRGVFAIADAVVDALDATARGETR